MSQVGPTTKTNSTNMHASDDRPPNKNSDEEANKTTVSNRSMAAGIINGNNYKESLQANHQETIKETVTKSNIDTPLSSDTGIYSHDVIINEVSEISMTHVQPSQLAKRIAKPEIKPTPKTKGPQNTEPSKSTWVRLTRTKKEAHKRY